MAKPNVVTKEELIEAAKRCIVEKGMQSLTLKSVAEAAGISQGTVYYHFRSKDQLMLEIVNDVCTNSWGELDRLADQKKNLNENWIELALKSAYERTTKDAYYHKLFLSLAVAGFNNEQIREQLGSLLSYENRALKDQINSLIEDSTLHGVSTDVWSVLLNALFDGLALQALMNQENDMERIYHDLQQLLKNLLDNSKTNN
ncbi:TetR family transcriptional regulator [Bacillus sp. SA1-12]|uniref:TetR/AcrR family transcriptional regulator n=1 Tax=Bacillus sp. SA1-12 TaxID=1455638 RepID=UPI00062747FD|nr:TetR/AcrR family transcriptional regulator [Bacillus sp. SA1-12]KKI89142.1 TetR family transcriptional regulator [Bacillus sp. SA1-12]